MTEHPSPVAAELARVDLEAAELRRRLAEVESERDMLRQQRADGRPFSDALAQETIRTQVKTIDELRAKYQSAEAMREAAANLCDSHHAECEKMAQDDSLKHMSRIIAKERGDTAKELAENIRAIPIPEPAAPAEIATVRKLPDDDGEVWIIYYDDRDREIELLSGCGATEAARRRYEQLSVTWNCHLFRRVSGDIDVPLSARQPIASASARLRAMAAEHTGDQCATLLNAADDLEGAAGIERDPLRRGGLPVIAGTRFTIAQLIAELADGPGPRDFVERFDNQDLDAVISALRAVAREYDQPDPRDAEIERLKAIVEARDAAMATFGADPPASSQDVPEAMIRALIWALGETALQTIPRKAAP